MLLLQHDHIRVDGWCSRGDSHPRASAFGKRCADSYPSGALENGGTPGTRTPDTLTGAAVFKTVSSTGRTRSSCCVKMVLPRGLAPRASAFARRRARLLHFGSRIEIWWLRPVSRRTLLLFRETLICLSYTAMMGNGSPAWTCTTTTRLTAGHAALTSLGNWENGPSARYRAAVSHLSSGCSAIELRRNGGKEILRTVSRRGPPVTKRVLYY
jgi:hypothetical protein